MVTLPEPIVTFAHAYYVSVAEPIADTPCIAVDLCDV